MKNLLAMMFLVLGLGALASCGGTARYIDSPVLRLQDGVSTPTEAVSSLFLQHTGPYTIVLCNADPATDTCIESSAGLSAIGVGGIFLPLIMDLSGIEVNNAELVEETIRLKTRLVSTVNKIAPKCGDVVGKINIRTGNIVNIELDNFYCNWMAVGNVVTNIKLSIDGISLKEQSFTGFYSISLHGTGNANGSGYYKALVVSNRQEMSF
jgi:hypothetical protein